MLKMSHPNPSNTFLGGGALVMASEYLLCLCGDPGSLMQFHEHALSFLQSQSSLCKTFKDFFQIF